MKMILEKQETTEIRRNKLPEQGPNTTRRGRQVRIRWFRDGWGLREIKAEAEGEPRPSEGLGIKKLEMRERKTASVENHSSRKPQGDG